MYQKIKEMAEAALKLQNKIFMEQTLRDISAMCDPVYVKVSLLAQDQEHEKYDGHGNPLDGGKLYAYTVSDVTVKVPNPEILDSMPPIKATELNKAAFGEVVDKMRGLEATGSIEIKTYGQAKAYETEAEMVTDIQGRPSPVIGVDSGDLKTDEVKEFESAKNGGKNE